MGKNVKDALDRKIMGAQQLSESVASWRNEGKKIVFTNGCFDIVHPGHIAYLAEASGQGDVLIVGINTDESVKKIKGENRPVNDMFSRSQLLASFFFVDAIVSFGEDTPINLINTVQPDVLVKGGDYDIETIVGARETLERGAEVKILSFLPGYSSTSIIEKIKKY